MIDLLPNEDEQAVLDNFRAVLRAEAPVSRLREAGVGDAGLLARMAELGWIGLGLSEEHGGVGYGIAEEMLLFREAGRHLVSPLLLGAVLGAHVAAQAGNAVLAGEIIAGEKSVALLIRKDAKGSVLRLDGAAAPLALIWDGAGMALYDAAALTSIEDVPALDNYVELERATLTGAPVLQASSSLPVRAKVLVSAMLVGVAEAARDMAVDYAKLREQFGQPIGAFQAIKHFCADMAVRTEAAHFQTLVAGFALRESQPDAAYQASAARIVAADAALRNGERNIQVHGGIGYTEAADPQLFIKRAQLLSELGGGTRQHKRDILNEQAPA